METEEDLAVEAASGVEDLEVEGIGGEDAGDECPTYILFGLARRFAWRIPSGLAVYVQNSKRYSKLHNECILMGKTRSES